MVILACETKNKCRRTFCSSNSDYLFVLLRFCLFCVHTIIIIINILYVCVVYDSLGLLLNAILIIVNNVCQCIILKAVYFLSTMCSQLLYFLLYFYWNCSHLRSIKTSLLQDIPVYCFSSLSSYFFVYPI